MIKIFQRYGRKATSIIAITLSLFSHITIAEDTLQRKIPIGVSTALTGTMSPFGSDIKNALSLANELYGENRYNLIFEDDQCDNRQAVTVAHKLVDLLHIKYILGHACNGSLIASLPIYNGAGALVLSSFATTGDIKDVGEKSFRLFPPDHLGAIKLFEYASRRYTKIAFLTSADDYTELMERWFRKTAGEKKSSMTIISDSAPRGQSDFRALFTRLKSSQPELIIINVNGEADFITAVKQARTLGITAPLTGFYLPASTTTITALGSLIEGVEFVNLPLLDDSITVEGKRVIDLYRSKFGEPKSIQLGVALTVDTFRLLDQALSSKQAPEEYIRHHKFTSLIGELTFDESGEVRGIPFQIQKISNGKVITLPE